MDPRDEVSPLAKLWDARGSLHIHETDFWRGKCFELALVFNYFKNLECDRQIGDRRGRNSVEGRVSGSSKACLQAQTF